MIRTSLILTSALLLTLAPGALAEEAPAPADRTPVVRAESTGPVVSTHGTAAALKAGSAAVDLKVRLVSRTGKFDQGHAVAVETTTGQGYALGEFDDAGNAKVAVPPGQYDVNAVEVSHAANGQGLGTATLMTASVRVTGDTTVTLDATRGKPVTALVAGVPTKLVNAEFGLMSGTRDGEVGGTVRDFVFGGEHEIFAVPSKVNGHVQAFFLRASLAAGNSASPTHHLAFLERGGIPADLTFEVRQGDLAAVQSTFGAYSPAATAERGSYATFDLPGTGEPRYPIFDQVVPSKSVEYYTAGVRWQHVQLVSADETEDGQATYASARYRAGRTYRQDWNSAPVGPSLGHGGVHSDGEELTAHLALFSGPNPDQYTEPYLPPTGSLTLSRDGKEIGRANRPDDGTFALPAGNGIYTLRSEATRNVPWTPLGTKIDTTWTFRDAADAFVVRTSGVDGRLKLTPQTMTGTPKLASATVDYSIDDGVSWRSAVVNGDQARIENPASGRFVSLRVTARDAKGNTVRQTVLKAYQVR